MQQRSAYCLALLVAAAGCGRTGINVPPGADGGFADDAGAAQDDEGSDDAGPGDEGPEDDDTTGDESGDSGAKPPVPDPPSPVDMDGCGNGIIEEGELCYLEMVVYPSRIDPCSIDVGDLDGDGHIDVAVPNSDFDHLESDQNYASVLYGDGQGNLSKPSAWLAGGDFAVGLKIADFDNDDLDDMVVTNSDAESANLLRGLGERSYAAPQWIGMGPEPTIANAGDLDGDGNLDLAVTTIGSNALMVALGRGDGTFQNAREYVRTMSPWDVEFLELNGDGFLDIVVSDTQGGIEVFWGDGTGALSPGEPLPAGEFPTGLTVTDLKNNGLADLVVAHATGVTLLVAEGGQDSTFWQSPELEAGVQPREVAVADFDNNGSLDLAVLAQGSEDITFLVETDWYDFAYAATKPVGTLPSGIRVADFNEDGVPDLAVSNQLDNNVGLILSNP